MRIIELGHVVLFVSNLERSAHFYKDILGFNQVHRSPQTAMFSAGRTHHELLLIEVGGQPEDDRQAKPGLYHIGFKIGDSPEAAKQVYQELKTHHVTIVGTGDHGMTHSIYILDPDGNELELYADVSEVWKTDPQALLQRVKALDLE